jgi:hypothetical protein
VAVGQPGEQLVVEARELGLLFAGQRPQGRVEDLYRVKIDFMSGRYALCKVTGRAGEGALGASATVTVPHACGGA